MEVTAVPRKNRRKARFYLRQQPKPQHDIRLLRPLTLPLGERFETLEDVHKYSIASEQQLDISTRREDQRLADQLHECRTSHQRCGLPSCPICARLFRIWFIGELLRIVEEVGAAQVHIETVLLAQAPYDKIEVLDVKRYDALLRKRLNRNGLADAGIIGGYENIYRAKSKIWMMHLNLVMIGGNVEDIRAFEDFTFRAKRRTRDHLLRVLASTISESAVQKITTANGSGFICGALAWRRRAALEFFTAELRRRHRVTSAKTATKYRYTAARLLVVRYLPQVLLSSANSAPMLETGLSVGLEIVFFTNPSFTSGYWLTWPSILCRIGGFVSFGGLLATAPPEALGALPIMSSMILSPTKFSLRALPRQTSYLAMS
jgi:hypothetical protein